MSGGAALSDTGKGHEEKPHDVNFVLVGRRTKAMCANCRLEGPSFPPSVPSDDPFAEDKYDKSRIEEAFAAMYPGGCKGASSIEVDKVEVTTGGASPKKSIPLEPRALLMGTVPSLQDLFRDGVYKEFDESGVVFKVVISPKALEGICKIVDTYFRAQTERNATQDLVEGLRNAFRLTLNTIGEENARLMVERMPSIARFVGSALDEAGAAATTVASPTITTGDAPVPILKKKCTIHAYEFLQSDGRGQDVYVCSVAECGETLTIHGGSIVKPKPQLDVKPPVGGEETNPSDVVVKNDGGNVKATGGV